MCDVDTDMHEVMRPYVSYQCTSDVVTPPPPPCLSLQIAELVKCKGWAMRPPSVEHVDIALPLYG